MKSAYSQLQTRSLPTGITAFIGTGERDPGRTLGLTDRKQHKDEQRITVGIVTCALQRVFFGRPDEARQGQNVYNICENREIGTKL